MVKNFITLFEQNFKMASVGNKQCGKVDTLPVILKHFRKEADMGQIFLLLFILLYLLSFMLIEKFRRRDSEDYLTGDEDEVKVYRISLWLCTFALAVSLGSALLLPVSIVSNEVLLLYPNSYYVKWLNSSLIQVLRYINIKSILQAPKTCAPAVVASMKVPAVPAAVFSPRSIGVEIGEKPIIARIQQEPIKYVPIVNPRSILPLLENEWQRQEVGLPSQKNEEIQAARLIVIRKHKMKKHQRRKLWKKMRHRWARVKQRRRITKEKIFQSELLSMLKAANDFSAEDYVRSKIEKANHRPLPTHWRHKRLPEFIIRQLLGIDKKINYKHTDTYKA